MAITQVRTNQIEEEGVKRADLNVSSAGSAVVRKLIPGTNITFSSTGVDAGTGDVTINASGGGSSAPRVQNNTSASGAVTCDWSSYDEINLTLTGDVTSLTFSGAVSGQMCRLRLIQDATGGRLIPLPVTGIKYYGDLPAYVNSGTASTTDMLLFHYYGTSSTYDFVAVLSEEVAPSTSLTYRQALSIVSLGI